jgi:hypothetical protein
VGRGHAAAFAAAARAARLRESAASAATLRAGIADVLPLGALALWCPNDLACTVCGEPDIPVDRLRAATQYKGGLNANTPSVRHFWAAVERLSMTQRAALLRYATGRQRLPADGHALTLERYQVGDAHVPYGATCYSTLQLPDYTSADAAYAKIVEALAQGFIMTDR